MHLLAGTSSARYALVRRLVDMDLVTQATVVLGPGDPEWHWISPRTPHVAGDGLWLRVLDVPAALMARGYGADANVIVGVHDRLFPDNAGAWRVDISDGRASLERTRESPHVELEISDLGACLLGHHNVAGAVQAGRVVEHRPGAARALWRALRSDVAPTSAMGL